MIITGEIWVTLDNIKDGSSPFPCKPTRISSRWRAMRSGTGYGPNWWTEPKTGAGRACGDEGGRTRHR